MADITAPGAFLGYKKNGDPFYLIAGGAPDTATDNTGTDEPDLQVVPQGGYTKEQVDAIVNERIEAVRQEEKDKLYSSKASQDEKFKLLQEEVKNLTKAQKEREKAAEAARKAKEAAERKAQESELSAKELLSKKEEEWTGQFAALQQQLEQAEAIRQQEARYAQLVSYAQRRVAEENDNIEPTLVKYITGDSEEEIENSIKQAIADSATMFQNAEKHFRGARAAMPGTAPTGNVPTGPMEQLDQQPQQVTKEEIEGVPMSQWGEYRAKRLGLTSGQGKGLFNQ